VQTYAFQHEGLKLTTLTSTLFTGRKHTPNPRFRFSMDVTSDLSADIGYRPGYISRAVHPLTHDTIPIANRIESPSSAQSTCGIPSSGQTQSKSLYLISTRLANLGEVAAERVDLTHKLYITWKQGQAFVGRKIWQQHATGKKFSKKIHANSGA